ncbi:alpha/beta-hydrolase [Cadophora sp. DSE1049]|nr:alpha/beta-hydrolase [Cadophora sp. DSE1049]
MKVSIPDRGSLQGATITEPVTKKPRCYQFSRVPYARPPYSFVTDGGFLQFGSNNYDDPSALLSETDVKCIIVCPAYRLGIFGFLASKAISDDSNFGFWDLRLALEWTYDNIAHFGGNPKNITVGGLSAGAYATFHQLAYDIGPTANRQIIRRVFQWSNGCGVQPKEISEAQQQFEDLIHVLGIPHSWTASQKADVLRRKPTDELTDAVGKMRQKFFRPISDGSFLSKDLFEDIYSGAFGKRMKDFGIQTVIGDLTQEYHVYKNVYPPHSYEELIERLSWDYPRDVALAICKPFKLSPADSEFIKVDWKGTFGKIYADMQIHSTMRGFLKSISTTLPLSHIHRYRIDWRTQSVDKRLPKDVGATHGMDLSIWLFGNGDTLTESEKVLIRDFLGPIASFINGDEVHWGTRSIDEVRRITARGKIEISEDEVWNAKLSLWETATTVDKTRRMFSPASKL